MNISLYIKNWAQEKIWWWYILPWLFFATLFIDIVNSTPQNGAEGPFEFILRFVFFGVHEMAHVVTGGFLPEILVAMAGSFSELILAWLFVIAALTKRAYFAAAMLLVLVTFASLSAGHYMADARARELDLVSVHSAVTGDRSQTVHDWEFTFSELGILEHDTKIGWLFKASGVVWGILGLLVGGGLMYAASRPKETAADIAARQNEPTFTEEVVEDKPQSTLLQGNDPTFMRSKTPENEEPPTDIDKNSKL